MLAVGGASGGYLVALGKPPCQWRRHKRRWFNPWFGKIPWSRAWQPTPVFLPGESPWTEKPGRPQFMGWQKGLHE